MDGTIETEAPKAKVRASHPLLTKAVPIDDYCTGDHWSAQDKTQLARLIAIVAMGQAAYAAYILKQLLPATPAFNDDDLRREAKVMLTVQEDGKRPRAGYPRWQRDGFIFEVISWIAARQTHGEVALLKDPHISATSQGLDGLMIELADDKSKVVMTTVFEDKCTDNPRETFLQKVIPALLERHRNKRSAELVAAASVLLRTAGIDEAAAARLAAAVMNRRQRRYRAAFALTTEHDSQEKRQKLFKGYDALDGVSAKQRVGASLIVNGKLREWFDGLALEGVAYLDGLEADGALNV
jgi:hypothetical protein